MPYHLQNRLARIVFSDLTQHSRSAAINMSYHVVVAHGGIPFSLSVPNAATQEAIAEGRSRKGVTVHKSPTTFRKSIRSL